MKLGKQTCDGENLMKKGSHRRTRVGVWHFSPTAVVYGETLLMEVSHHHHHSNRIILIFHALKRNSPLELSL